MTYTTLARLPSSSSSATYEVATEGTHLTCNCPGWTRQVHFRDCPALDGRSCTCRGRFSSYASQPKDARTCKHTREIEPYVRRLGGIPQAVAACLSGRDIRMASAPVVVQTPVRRMAPPQPARRCTTLGCTRAPLPGTRHCQRHTVRVAATSPVPMGGVTASEMESRLRATAPPRVKPVGGRAIRIREEDA